MSPTLDAFVRSWPFAPWLMATLTTSAVIYLRGWQLLHHRDPKRWHIGRLVAFLGGLVAIFLALASPIEPFTSMVQACSFGSVKYLPARFRLRCDSLARSRSQQFHFYWERLLVDSVGSR